MKLIVVEGYEFDSSTSVCDASRARPLTFEEIAFWLAGNGISPERWNSVNGRDRETDRRGFALTPASSWHLRWEDGVLRIRGPEA